jgi:hypothetical protein
LEKAGVWWWCFDGWNVVECGKNVVKRWRLFGANFLPHFRDIFLD